MHEYSCVKPIPATMYNMRGEEKSTIQHAKERERAINQSTRKTRSTRIKERFSHPGIGARVIDCLLGIIICELMWEANRNDNRQGQQIQSL